MNRLVRTRFAPSPTGYLHVGGARTALFNYLLARKLGGRFVLRIEDTDQTRNVRGAADKLLDDMRWLGLQWDEGPQVGGVTESYFQSQRLERYRERAAYLIERGHAYYAFDTREELDALRTAAQKAKRAFRYPRPAQFPTAADVQRARDAGRPVVVRFRMPGHDFEVRDRILGEVRIAAAELDDFVILKSDGWPTYHFAVVVDDEDMQITHVLRGQEHLMNTPNHLALQEAFGYASPDYAHLPIILNMDGTKMSKREKDKAVRSAAELALRAARVEEAALRGVADAGDEAFDAWRRGDTQLESAALRRLARRLAVSVPEIEIHDFRASGYLPEVLINFIALLGWSAGDDREKLTLGEMEQLFTVERVGKTNARFDRAKLLNFNTTALAAADAARRLAGMRDYLAVNPDSPLASADDATLHALLAMNEGFRLFRDVDDKSAVLFVADDAYEFDADAVQKTLLKGEQGGLKLLQAARPELAAVSGWSAATIEAAIRAFCERNAANLGKVAQPLRVAVTGATVSPPIFETLALLGQERTLRRIDRCLAQFAGGSAA